MSSFPCLSVQNVHVIYGSHIALDGASLAVAEGETFGLIGLNGAGKTSLIKCILGLRELNAGKIEIDGQENYSQSTREKFAYLPERFNPPSFLTGIEFLRFSLNLYKRSLPDTVFFEKAEAIALDPAFLTKKVNTYSKGMRQKLGLLATILSGCKLLILDEPMSGLDPRARSNVKSMLRQAKKEGTTIFLSSHILSDMAELCDHVSVLHNKKIVFDGAPAEMIKFSGKQDMESAFLAVIEEKERGAA